MKKTTKPGKAKAGAKAVTKEWDLRLYIAGPSSRSNAALHNLEKLCDAHLAGRYHIAVIDLVKTPQLAHGEQILALPALVRHLPAPIRKVVGDLSNQEQVLVGLDLRVRTATPFTPHDGDENGR